MTPTLAWFSGTSAQSLCWALVHSLWQGLIWSLLLALYLSLVPRTKPGLRYTAGVCCLAGLSLGVLVTWSILRIPVSLSAAQRMVDSPNFVEADTTIDSVRTASVATGQRLLPSSAAEIRSRPDTSVRGDHEQLTGIKHFIERASPLLLWVWLTGVGLHLFQCIRNRAAAAEWKQGEPVSDPAVLELFAALKTELRIRRPVRLIASLRAYGPCVVGTFVPAILIPVALVSGMSPEQWKAVLSHELAHLRRWDDLMSFGQQVLESLLFFNPAVWWISRQINAEREACCDAWGVRVTSNPLNYAQILLEIAEKLTTNPVAQAAPALAFADERTGSLLDRIQRLVAANGYRNRWTWPGTLLLIVFAGTIIALLQRGTDLAIFSAAKLLSDRERVTELAKVAEEVNPQIGSEFQRLFISGKVRTSDGGPLPKSIWIHSQTHKENSTTGMTLGEIRGEQTDEFRVDVPPGKTSLQFVGEGYAAAFVGPYLSGRVAEIQDVEVTLEPGVALTLQVVDESGQPVVGASVTAFAWEGTSGSGLAKAPDTDTLGQTVFTHIDPARRHSFSVTAPGFQKLDQPAAHLSTETPLRLEMTRAVVATGKVLGPDAAPLSGATLSRLRTRRFQYVDHSGMGLPPLATTNNSGEFTLDQLLDGYTYDLLVQHPDYAYEVLRNVQPGSRDLVVQLQRGVTVSGLVRGTPQQFEDLRKVYHGYRVLRLGDGILNAEELSFNSPLTLHPSDGAAPFQLNNLPKGKIVMILGEQRVERELTGSISDLVIDLKSAPLPAKRNVELVFRNAGEVVAPEGQLQLSVRQILPGNQTHQDFETATFSDGRMITQLAVPCEYRIQTNRLIGFTPVDNDFVAQVPSGEGTFVVDVPVQKAGGVSGTVLNSDGSPATNVSVVLETVVTRRTLLNTSEQRRVLNSQVNDSGEFFFSPVPFGAKCEIRAARDKFYVLGPQFTMSEHRPLPEFKLQFNSPVPAGVRVLDPAGNPLRGIPVIIRCEHPRMTTSWGPGEATNSQGEVMIAQVNPDMVAFYQAIIVPTKNYRNTVVALKGDHTVEVRLQPGLFLAGKLIHTDGHPLSGRRVTAAAGRYFGIDKNRYTAEGLTDDEGNFRFSNLPDEEVRIELEYGSRSGGTEIFTPTTEDQIKPITIRSNF